MRIGMAQVGGVALAAGAAALAAAGWTVFDADSDAFATAAPLALEVERLDAPAASSAEAGRDLLSGPNGMEVAGSANGNGDPHVAGAPDVPVELWMNRAVAVDPFRPDREPGAGYQLPWERRSWAPPEIEEEDPPEIPQFRVVGIVVPSGNRGGAALIQREGEDPRLYRVGERVAGYQLTELSADVAVLDGPAGALNFMVDQPYADRSDDDDRRRGRGNDDERQQQREEALRQRELQRARAQVIDAIRRRTGGNGNDPQELAMADMLMTEPVYFFPADAIELLPPPPLSVGRTAFPPSGR
jgi:hypothetical protein